MKPIKMLAKRRQKILELARLHGATQIRIFGSVARGDADRKSDVDFLVQMEPGRTLLDMGGLLMDLQRTLGRPVDVVTEKGLKDRIREKVLQEAMPL
jgi:predicted nucleotidyltransferase